MTEPEAGKLFACRWEPDGEGAQESFRIFEVVRVGSNELFVWVYADAFAQPPSFVDVTVLRRINLHEALGGPIAVPKAEFMSWHPVAVARARAR